MDPTLGAGRAGRIAAKNQKKLAPVAGRRAVDPARVEGGWLAGSQHNARSGAGGEPWLRPWEGGRPAGSLLQASGGPRGQAVEITKNLEPPPPASEMIWWMSPSLPPNLPLIGICR